MHALLALANDAKIVRSRDAQCNTEESPQEEDPLLPLLPWLKKKTLPGLACKQVPGDPERSEGGCLHSIDAAVLQAPLSRRDRFAYSSVSRSPNFFPSLPGAWAQAIPGQSN